MSLNHCQHWEEVVGVNGWRGGGTRLHPWLDVLRGLSLAGDSALGYMESLLRLIWTLG